MTGDGLFLLKLEKGDELIHAQARLTNNRAKRAAINLSMIRDSGLRLWLSANQSDVTAALPVNDETCPFECSDALRA